MAAVELTEKLLNDVAGWQVLKEARGLLAQDRVLSSDWKPPRLRGVVQGGATTYQAGLVLQDRVNVDNLCTCRQSRQWGTICAHSVAAALHWLRSRQRPEPHPNSSTAATVISGSAQSEPTRPGKQQGQRVRRADASTTGKPVELFVILPPNLEAAVARGKVMVCFEGEWPGGRKPLNALPSEQAFQFSEADLALLDHIEAVADGDTPAALMLDRAGLADLLPKLAGHPHVTLGKSKPITISQEPFAPPIKATLETDGSITLSYRDRLSAAPCVIEGQWIVHQQTIQPLGLGMESKAWAGGRRKLSRDQVPGFLMQEWPRWSAAGAVEANFDPEDFTLAPLAPRFHLHLAGGLAQLEAQLQCAYGPRIMTIGAAAEAESLWLPDPESPTTYSPRDVNAEREALGRLVRAGFSTPDARGRLHLRGQNSILNFFARDFARLQHEWNVTMEERLERSTAKHLERLEPQFEIRPAGVQWFDLGIAFTSPSGEQLSAADIQRLLLSGQGHHRLKNGKIAVVDTGAIEELQEVLRDCAPRQQETGYHLRAEQAGFLQATFEEQGWQAKAPADWRERAGRQSGQAPQSCPSLGPLDSVLRPYQKSGVAWLHFLRANRFGGVLADEMGLGKTLQALALIDCQRRAALARTDSHAGKDHSGPPEERAKNRRPTLIVCPTSLVFNWVAEARKFTPDLNVLAVHGTNRQSLFAQVAHHDLVVTSYALLRRDADRYGALEFDTVILDEAQHIKNRQTQNARAVKAIRARHRLVLTGTPLENSVLDLWSIFDFLMPGYLGAASDFRERYEGPITRDRDAAAQRRLARRLRPFILRRTKREVAPDLPARIEQVAYCELTADQRAVYQQLFEATRHAVLQATGEQNPARSRMIVLNALLRLRQVCCDVRLLEAGQAAPEQASAKMDLFGELLDEAIDGGHRVLVFSQFVRLLALLQEKLKQEKIAYCYLDGSTPNRGEVVERFQRQSDIPVFLISLKAGGVGLNLTGADTVIHFDPWWNPAVEAQATDRAHRIGQTRIVTSYKLIARDTIEEKILALQSRKRELIQATLGSEDQLAQALSWEEIQDLLA